MASLARVSAAFDEAFSELPKGLAPVEHALTTIHSDRMEQEKSPITQLLRVADSHSFTFEEA